MILKVIRYTVFAVALLLVALLALVSTQDMADNLSELLTRIASGQWAGLALLVLVTIGAIALGPELMSAGEKAIHRLHPPTPPAPPMFETSHVPRNRDALVRAMLALEVEYRKVINAAESLLEDGIDLHSLPPAWEEAWSHIDEVTDAYMVEARVAGEHFQAHLKWIESSIAHEAHKALMEPDWDAFEAREKNASYVDRAIARLDRGELWEESDYVGSRSLTLRF